MTTAKDIISTEFPRAKKHGWDKVCHKCGKLIEGEAHFYEEDNGVKAIFHKDCYNQYEHYYGLDRPID